MQHQGATAREPSSSRPGQFDNRTHDVVWRLHSLADYQDGRSKPVDWSFRTGPEGLNRQAREH